MLWFDHTLLKEGEAYTNTTGLFYDMEDEINGYFTYALPYKQIVSDKSITGAKIPCAEGPTGISINGNPILTGTSGWAAIPLRHGGWRGELFPRKFIKGSTHAISEPPGIN